MSDDSTMKMYEAQAMLIEEQQKTQEALRENECLRREKELLLQLTVDQQRNHQIHSSATEKTIEDRLVELENRLFERGRSEQERIQKAATGAGIVALILSLSISQQKTDLAIKKSKEKFRGELTKIREAHELEMKEQEEKYQISLRIEQSLRERITEQAKKFGDSMTILHQRIHNLSEEIEELRTKQAHKNNKLEGQMIERPRRTETSNELPRTDLVWKKKEELQSAASGILSYLWPSSDPNVKKSKSKFAHHGKSKNETNQSIARPKETMHLVVIGGWKNEFTDSIYMFNSMEKTWRICKKRLPCKLKGHGSSILNSKLYLMGGTTPGNIGDPSNNCYKLGENGEWIKMADMNEKRMNISRSTIAFGSEIWVIGGWNGKENLKTVEKYDHQADSWTKMPELNVQRNSSAISKINGKIYVSGGWDWKMRLKSVEVYDPAKNKWEIFCDMPVALNAHCSIVEGTNLIIIGGRKYDGTPSDEVWKIDVFDPKKEWIKMLSLKQERFGHEAVKLSNGIMVFGGAINNETRIDSVEIFDGISWKEGPKLLEACGFFSSIPLSCEEKQLLKSLC